MDLATLRSLFELPSIVVWFALLVTVFAAFVGVGLYVARRDSRKKASAARAELPAPPPRKPDAATKVERRAGNHSRSRRGLNHPQETS